MPPSIIREELKKEVRYDPDTGLFHWLKRKRGRRMNETACKPHPSLGYRAISLNYYKFHAHRLAFLYMNGWMPQEVDHINRDKSDNRWINLRAAGRFLNGINRGARGYRRVSTGWLAVVRVCGKGKISLGTFRTEKEASAAYQGAYRALVKLYGDEAKLRPPKIAERSASIIIPPRSSPSAP